MTSTALAIRPLIARSDRETVRSARSRPPLLSRRNLCLALGVLWLLDGALQLQSFMFSTGFANSVIAPAGSGQPYFVSGPVAWNAHLIAGHPELSNAFFAAFQLAFGAAFLFRRTAKAAIIGSVVWCLGVWFLGEGLGGLAGGHVTGLLGAPGAAPLYGVLALAAWPRADSLPTFGLDQSARPAAWSRWVWAALWTGFAVLSVLPGNGSAHAISDQLTANASSVPSWLAGLDRTVASAFRFGGVGSVVFVAAAELAIGVGALAHSRVREVAVWAGMVLAGLFWAAGQSFGQLFSGQATDPSTGPLVLLMGLTVLAATGSCVPSTVMGAPMQPERAQAA